MEIAKRCDNCIYWKVLDKEQAYGECIISNSFVNVGNQKDSLTFVKFKFDFGCSNWREFKDDKNNKLFSFKEEKIKHLKDEIERWENEKSAWCYEYDDIRRGGDTCDKFNRCKPGIMIGICHDCWNWEPNRKEIKKN